MVSALVSRSSSLGASFGQGVVFLGKTLYSCSASLHPKFNAGGHLAMDWRGEKKYSESLHATETKISSSLTSHLARMQTLS